MTEMTQDQQAALQVTAAQVAAKFEGFVAALSADEQQVLAVALADAPYGVGIQGDTRGFADNNPRLAIGLFRLAGFVLAAATSVATDLAKDLTKPILPPQPQ